MSLFMVSFIWYAIRLALLTLIYSIQPAEPTISPHVALSDSGSILPSFNGLITVSGDQRGKA